MIATPVVKDLVLVGGGHTHVEVLRRFGMNPLGGLRITVVSRELESPYSGMLPGVTAGHYSVAEAHIDLRPLARFANARLIHAEVTGLDLDGGTVEIAGRPSQPFDLLSLNVGSTPSMTVPGAAEHAIPVKPIGRFLPRFEALAERVDEAGAPRHIVIVGGGAGGVEMILSLHHRLGSGPRAPRFTLVTRGAALLDSLNAQVQRVFAKICAERGIEVITEAEVTAVSADHLTVEDGSEIAFDELIWVIQAGAPEWLGESGLETDSKGFVAVDASLRSQSHANVFAAGDVAAVLPHPRPKSGVFAVRQGPPLAANLRRVLLGAQPRPFRPQRQFLALISTGDRHAVASRGPFTLSGRWVWRWKDAIDRRFMERYADLPAMQPDSKPRESIENPMPFATMRCGGCGSKLGPDLLHAALDRVKPQAVAGVHIGLDRADDAAVVTPPSGQLCVQTIDAFRSFIDDPWMLGQVAATHCLSDVFAMGAQPHSALALVTLPLATPSKMQDELAQLLAGAQAVFAREHTALVGGHTSEGLELSIGFSITAWSEEAGLLSKRGARSGDALILTKPLGTGIVFAADMQGRASGREVAAALAAMLQSNRAAADCIKASGAHAVTDVTGFGLLGHLGEMLDDGHLGVELRAAALPALEGARRLAQAGILSSLHPDIVRHTRGLLATEFEAHAPASALLFDPQTSGGLLAAVPASAAADCVTRLREAGCEHAAIIGTVTDRRDAAATVRIVD